MIQALLLDISGVLHLDQKPIAGAVEAVARLRQMGLPLRFLTNSSRQNRRQLWQQRKPQRPATAISAQGNLHEKPDPETV